MKKVYGMPGKVNAQIVISSPSGKTKYKIPFTGGSLNDRNKTEAKFITDSETFGEAVPTVAAPEAPAPATTKKTGKAAKNAAQEQAAPQLKVMEEITDMGAAIAVLTEAGEVAAGDVLDVEGVLKKAQEMGFSFPNLK